MENTNSPPNHSSSHNLLITIIVITATVIVFLTLYLILRYRCNCLRRRSTPSSSTVPYSGNRISPEITSSSVVDSLPLFTFSSITRRSSSLVSGDCAVCLSKFEQTDLLRLLPLCCHAFHTQCIDAWLSSNLTCPICRSAVVVSDSELMKIFPPSSASLGNTSFRLEIGNISNRREAGTTASDNVSGETDRRSYSIGEFEYLVEEEAEIRAFSFGSSRRVLELQANNGYGVEITEMFRWISGV